MPITSEGADLEIVRKVDDIIQQYEDGDGEGFLLAQSLPRPRLQQHSYGS
ncbi:unnamed protein product [Effrenium voratum]|nr:unnamed protein product [Effrenium voratum]